MDSPKSATAGAAPVKFMLQDHLRREARSEERR